LKVFKKESQKSNKTSMGGTITRVTKREGQKRPKDAQPVGTKKGKKLIPFVVGSYFTHDASNVACM
jgi:hypothetical protein